MVSVRMNTGEPFYRVRMFDGCVVDLVVHQDGMHPVKLASVTF